MLWSPNEVLAYVKEDLNFPQGGNAVQSDIEKLNPISPFGGFTTTQSHVEDFILIAENSEIHGPNPLFTIPKLDPSVDLNKLATLILSADYQGLGNNKILPGRNAQLLMPDLAPNTHAAINYFFLFDSEARGFIRPLCVAYFTAEKYKLVQLAESLLKHLGEVGAILQHSNIMHHTKELQQLNNSMHSITNLKLSRDAANQVRLQEIQDILNIVESYKGNEVYENQIEKIMELLKKNALSSEVQNFDSIFTPSDEAELLLKDAFKPSIKTNMKRLSLLINKGLVLALYHLHVMHKFFRRKYGVIAASESFTGTRDDSLLFGACILSSFRDIHGISNHHLCTLSYSMPSSLSLESADYFECLDSDYYNILLNYKNSESKNLKLVEQSNSSENLTSFELQNDSSCKGLLNGILYSEAESDKVLSKNKVCKHVQPLLNIWNSIEYIKQQNPGIESSFLHILKLFNETQRILFAVFTQVPIVVISTPSQLQLAQDFLKALSIFIPRKRNESLFVDLNRQSPLEREKLSEFAAVNICLNNCGIENFIPSELLTSLCILNLKDSSFTAPTYTGSLLSTINQQIQALTPKEPVFPIFVSIFSEIERTIGWWNVLTSSAADSAIIASHMISKGFNRLDMQIIEALSRLRKI